MKGFLSTLLSIFAIAALGQQKLPIKIRVADFSKDYYALVEVSDTGDDFVPGTITVYETKTNKPLIQVSSDELALEMHNGKLLPNIEELPYGEQSIIIYEDFNFDGKKDLAIQDGQNSCYHGPSYRIYLSEPSGFVYDSDFTRLAQEYCGMFAVDSANRELHTMTKDGCCWHQFSDFIIENNKPKAIEIDEENASNIPYFTESHETWNGKKMVKTSTTTLVFDTSGDMSIKPVFSFNLEKSGKQIILFNINDRTLNYAMLRKDSTLEFAYPSDTDELGTGHFICKDSTKQSWVLFTNNHITYKIYDIVDNSGTEKVGVEIDEKNKKVDLKGVLTSKKGSLYEIRYMKLDNVSSN